MVGLGCSNVATFCAVFLVASIRYWRHRVHRGVGGVALRTGGGDISGRRSIDAPLRVEAIVPPRIRAAVGQMLSNNAFERTVGHRGPRLAAARSLWSAAQLGC